MVNDFSGRKTVARHHRENSNYYIVTSKLRSRPINIQIRCKNYVSIRHKKMDVDLVDIRGVFTLFVKIFEIKDRRAVLKRVQF